MMIPTHVSLLYFSPTGTTRKALEYIAEGIGLPITHFDLTPFNARWKQYSFTTNDLVLIGLPVYRGVLPPVSEEFFRGLTANQSPAVFIVTYGNRDYENALLELKDRCEEAGFVGIAAAATIGEHSITSEIAAGRPDEQDRELLQQFGRQISEKLLLANIGGITVPGTRPYAKTVTDYTTLLTYDNCDQCGLCAANCPVMAVNPSDVTEIDARRCIGCLRCVHNCPQNARKLTEEHKKKVVSLLTKVAGGRKEPEFYMK